MAKDMPAPKTGLELRECPFCGGGASLGPRWVAANKIWRVSCDTAFCCLGCDRDSMAEAIAAWNTRSLPALDAVVKALEVAHSMAMDGVLPNDAKIKAWGEALALADKVRGE